MTEKTNDVLVPFFGAADFLAALEAKTGAALIGWRPRPLSKLERAQAIAAEVRARRGMVVRKGVYLDLIK